jgi:hypothetical protein
MKNVLHSAHDKAGLIGILGFRVQGNLKSWHKKLASDFERLGRVEVSQKKKGLAKKNIF